MKKRNAGVNEERITGDGCANDPVGGLVKKEAGENEEELRTAIDNDFEED